MLQRQERIHDETLPTKEEAASRGLSGARMSVGLAVGWKRISNDEDEAKDDSRKEWRKRPDGWKDISGRRGDGA
jgi:hypothetical protein